MEDLEDIAAHFYEDFENKAHNFREFYRKLKNYLQTDVLGSRELSEEFADILRRVLARLEEVEHIDASASFECLKSTMSIYLLQEEKPGRSANWIVRNFEQIDGDILRSGHENPNTIYHFACLEDEDVGTVKKSEFPWPLNDDFFEVAQNPVDWKYQVYVKCCDEYKNFKRYALIYGLEFNRAKFKLSYVKRDGDKEREPYYLLKMLGLKKTKYANTKISNRLADSSSIGLKGNGTGKFNSYDYYRFRICKYRFLTETLIESNTVYKDNFLLLKYMEVMLENAIKEDMQGKPVSEAILIKKLDDKFDDLKKCFPFAQNINRLDVINNIRNRMVNGKAKKFAVLSAEDRRYMMIRELFIHKKLETAKNAGVDIMQDKFPNVNSEQIMAELAEEKLNDLSQNPSKDELIAAIKSCNKELRRDKARLTDYVPYKLLYPFFDSDGLEEGLFYIKNDKHKRLIAYMERLSGNENLLYTILDGTGLQKRIRINPHWRKLLVKNYSVIRSWVQYNKAEFLQDRNPGVPGIIYKICPENEDLRKLENARSLWKSTVEITGEPIKEIYTGREIPLDTLSIDHFVPRSYISNDEIWNLTPMSKALNSSKNNRLPSWDAFFEPFARYQYYLYSLVFPADSSQKSNVLIEKFEKCRKNNLNAIWASDTLYIPGNSEIEFISILGHNLKPIYEAAQLQGYDIWNLNN